MAKKLPPKLNIPEDLPDSKIITELTRKSNENIKNNFRYVDELENFRKRVVPEMDQINLLFPEYTPHNEKYHLKNLFNIADNLLEEPIIEKLNVVELFLLTISLYGHDWGMAVSEKEKACIIANEKNDNDDFVLLDNEQSEFSSFCKSKNIAPKDIDDDNWREYVRQTHALRSGKRIKHYFETIDSGLAEYASRICIGHYLDFYKLEDNNKFPTNYSIKSEVVNVKALTVYLRLVDLLDLADDRTPYILWKFISPENKYSKMEWEKHRSLRPITFQNYPGGRFIQIDGSTEDHNVYYSLLDLQKYVDEQYSQSKDILLRMSHDYYKLNIHNINWRIEAINFKPIPIRFEFDRIRMFQILADEIYEGDYRVFLRELLQNSIDAIRMRIEVLKKNKNDSHISGRIDVEVEETEKQYIVTFKDNGIGMDQYVIKNYLSVAGKSYYGSSDFEKIGIKMDPISRFGVGILSCFMVADTIEIITYRDPYTQEKPEKLKIVIFSKENYFRIENIEDNIEIGTTVKVFVLKEKLPLDAESNRVKLDVTSYLYRTAGFVDYPILIKEQNRKSTIVHPSYNTKEIVKTENTGFVYRLTFEHYPYGYSAFKDFFTQKKLSIKKDLKLANYDGYIVFFIPKSDRIDAIEENRKNFIFNTDFLKIKDSFFNKYGKEEILNRFSYRFELSDYKVFLNGILINNISNPRIYSDYYYSESFIMPLPMLIVNLPKQENMKMDLARTKIDGPKRWDSEIWEHFISYIKNSIVKKIFRKNIESRILEIGRAMIFYPISSEQMLLLIIKDKFPIILHSAQKETIIKAYKQIEDKPIKRLAIDYYNYAEEIQSKIFGNTNKYKSIFKFYKGEDVLLKNQIFHFGDVLVSIKTYLAFHNFFLNKFYTIQYLEFLTTPLKDLSCFPCETLIFSNTVESDFKKAQEIFESFARYRLDKFTLPTIVEFKSPYKSKFAYSNLYFNYNHAFCKVLVKVFLTILRNYLEPVHYKFIKEYFDDKMNIKKFNKKMNILINHLNEKYIKEDKIEFIELKLEDFIETTVDIKGKTKNVLSYKSPHLFGYSDLVFESDNKEWGELLK